MKTGKSTRIGKIKTIASMTVTMFTPIPTAPGRGHRHQLSGVKKLDLLMIASYNGSQKKMDMKMENQLRDQLTSATKDFFLLLEEGDIEKWIDLWAEDGIDKKPYATGMFPEEIVGKKGIYDVWRGITKVFDRISFPIHEFIVDEEKRTVVVRSDGKGLMKNDGS